VKQKRLLFKLAMVAAITGLILVGSGKSFGSTNSVSSDAFLPQIFSLSWFSAPDLQSCTIKWNGQSLTYRWRYNQSKRGSGRTSTWDDSREKARKLPTLAQHCEIPRNAIPALQP